MKPTTTDAAIAQALRERMYEHHPAEADGWKWIEERAAYLTKLSTETPATAHGEQPAGGFVVDGDNHKLDTDTHVFFYEQDFYVLSNFSAFTLQWKGTRFDTSEAAYHYEKFSHDHSLSEVRNDILLAPSAHEAFKLAERYKKHRRPDWDEVKVGIMREILTAKAEQHAYVRRKLLATGDRILVEDSWRDDYWGWGPNRDGQNMLGQLWMEVRASMRGQAAPTAQPSAKDGVRGEVSEIVDALENQMLALTMERDDPVGKKRDDNLNSIINAVGHAIRKLKNTTTAAGLVDGGDNG